MCIRDSYIPYVIEPSLGCDRVALAFLCEAYDEEHLTDGCLLYTSTLQLGAAVLRDVRRR